MLGSAMLVGGDSSSLITKDEHDSVQALFWDLTNNQSETLNNQDYYVMDIDAQLKSHVDLRIANLRPGRYRVSVYRVGYRINDPYSDYLDMGRPAQLTRNQVATIKKRNTGEPVLTEMVEIAKDELLTRTYDLRENDVYFVCAERLAGGRTFNR
jgi:xylan 1,4-beta-xylosidase